MSIASEIERISSAKLAISGAIVAKGGTVTEGSLIDTYAAAISALPTSGGGADVTLGVVDSNGAFQPLSFSGTSASISGSPETVETYKTWDSPLPPPYTAQGQATYTPTTSNLTIPAGRYLVGSQTILGDAALVASNIKSGASIFGVVGSYEGGGGGGATGPTAVKIVEYLKPHDAFTALTSVAVTGFPSNWDPWDVGDSSDITFYNGLYAITADTEFETDNEARLYANANGSAWFKYIVDADMGESGWVFTTNKDDSSYYGNHFAYGGATPPSGTNSWYNTDYGVSVNNVTTTLTSSSYTSQAFSLTTAQVASVTSGGVWSFAGSSSISGAVNTPVEGYIQLQQDSKIISQPIAHPGPGIEPALYLPLHCDTVAATGQTVNTSGVEFKTLNYNGRDCCQVISGPILVTVPQQQGSGPRTLSGWLCGLPTSGWNEIFGFGTWTTDTNLQLVFRTADTNMHPFIFSNDLLSNLSYSGKQNSWHHVILSVTADGAWAVYWDGTLKGSGSLGSSPSYDNSQLYIGGNGGVYFSDIKLFTAALTQVQAEALYKQEALYGGVTA